MITNAYNKPTKAQLECSYARPNFQGSAEGISKSLCLLLSSANIDADIKVKVTSTCKGPRSHPLLANDLAAILLAASSVKHCTLTGVSPYYVPPTAYYRPESFADCEKLASCELPIDFATPPDGNLVIRLVPFKQRTSLDLYSSTTDLRPADLVYVPNYLQQWGSQGAVQYDYDGVSIFKSQADVVAGDARRVQLLAGTLYERPGTNALELLCGSAAGRTRLTISKRTEAISVDVPITRDSAGNSAPARVGYQPELSIIGGVIIQHYSVPRRFILRGHNWSNDVIISKDSSGFRSVSLPRAFSNITTIIAFVLQTKLRLAYLNLAIPTNRTITNDPAQLHPNLRYFAARFTNGEYRLAAIRESLQLRRYAPSPNTSGGWLSSALELKKGWDSNWDIWDVVDQAKNWNTKLWSTYDEAMSYQLCAVLEITKKGSLDNYRPILNDDKCEHLPPPRPRALAKTYFKSRLDLNDWIDFDHSVQDFIDSLSHCKPENLWFARQVYHHAPEIRQFMNCDLPFKTCCPRPKANMKPRAAMALYQRYTKQLTMVLFAFLSMVYFGFTQGGLFFLALTFYYLLILGITVLQSTHPRASNVCPPMGFTTNYNINITLLSYYHQDQQCLEPVNRYFNLSQPNPTQTWEDFLIAYANYGVFGVLDDANRLVLYTRGEYKGPGFYWYYAMNSVVGEPHIQLAYLWPNDDPDFKYPSKDIQDIMDYLTANYAEFKGDALETSVTLSSGCCPVYEDSWFIFTGRSITAGAPNTAVTTPLANELYQFATARPENLIEAVSSIYKQSKAFVIEQLELFKALNLEKGRPSLWRLPSLRTMILSFAAAFTLAIRESLPKMVGSVLESLQLGFNSLMSTIHTTYCSILGTLGFQECRLFAGAPHANTQASSIEQYLGADQPPKLSFPRPSPGSIPSFDQLQQRLVLVDTNVNHPASSEPATPTSTSSPLPDESEPIEPEQSTHPNSPDPMMEDTSVSSNPKPSPTQPTELLNKPEPYTTSRQTLTFGSLPPLLDSKSESTPTSPQQKEDLPPRSLVTIRNERLDIGGLVSLTFQLSTQVCQRDYERGQYEQFANTLAALIPQIYSTTLDACRPTSSTSRAVSTQVSASRGSSQSSSSAQPKSSSSQKVCSSSTSTQVTTTSSSMTTPLYQKSSVQGYRPSALTSERKTKQRHPRKGMSSFSRATTREFMMHLITFSALWLCTILFGAWPSLMLAVCLLVIRHSTHGLPRSWRTFAVVTVISLCSAPSASAFSIKSAFSSAKSTLTSTLTASRPSETPSSIESQPLSQNPQQTCEYGSILDTVFPPTCKYELSSNLGQSSQTGFAKFWKATKSVASASWDYIATSDIVADVTDVAMDLAHSRTATKVMNAATTAAETVSSAASKVKTTITDTYDRTTSAISSKINDVKEKISDTTQAIHDNLDKTAATVDYLYEMMPTLAYNEGYVTYTSMQVGPLVRSDVLNVDLTVAIEDGRPSLTIRQSLVTSFTMAKSTTNNNKNSNTQNAPKAKSTKAKKQRLVPRLGYRQRVNVTTDPYVPFMRTVLDPAHAMQYNATAAPLDTQLGYVLHHYVNEFGIPAEHRSKMTDCWYFLPDIAAVDAFMVYRISTDADYHTAVLRNPSDNLGSQPFWLIAKSVTLTHMGPAKDRGGIFYGHRAAFYENKIAGTVVLKITRPLYSTTNLSGIYATAELADLRQFSRSRAIQASSKFSIVFPDGSTCTCPDMPNIDFSTTAAFWTTVVHYIPPTVGYTGLTAKVCSTIAVADDTKTATLTYNSSLSMPLLEVGLEAGLGFYPGNKNDLRQVLNTVRDFWRKNRTWIGAVSSLVPYGKNITAAIDALAQ